MTLFVKALSDHFRKEWMTDFGYARPHDELAKGFTGPAQSSHSTQLATPFTIVDVTQRK
jgi:hypothetical protein